MCLLGGNQPALLVLLSHAKCTTLETNAAPPAALQNAPELLAMLGSVSSRFQRHFKKPKPMHRCAANSFLTLWPQVLGILGEVPLGLVCGRRIDIMSP